MTQSLAHGAAPVAPPALVLTAGQPAYRARTDQYEVALTPDGRTLLTALGPWGVLLDTATGLPRRWLPAKGPQPGLWALSPDGRSVLRSEWQRGLDVLDLESGASRTLLGPNEGHLSVLEGSPARPDRMFCADLSRFAAFVDLRTGAVGPHLAWPPEERAGASLRWATLSPDGARLVTACDVGVDVWDCDSGEHVRRVTARGQRHRGAAWRADGEAVIVALNDKRFLVADVTRATHDREVPSPTPYVENIAATRDGRSIVTWSLEQDLAVYSADDLARQRVIPLGGFAQRVCSGVERDVAWVHTQAGELLRVRLDTGEVQRPPGGGLAHAAAFDASDAHVVVARRGGVVDRVALATERLSFLRTSATPHDACTLTPRATRAAYASHYVAHEVEIATGESRALPPLEGRSLGVRGEDGASAHLEPSVVRLEPGDRRVALPSFPGKATLSEGRFSRSGRWLALRAGPNVAVIDVDNASVAATGKYTGCHSLALGDDGVAAVSLYGKVAVFGVAVKPASYPLDGVGAFALAFQPGGTLLALGLSTGEVELLDRTSPTLRGRTRVMAGGIWAVAFSSDGSRLVVAGDESVARVFDVAALRAAVLPERPPAKALAKKRRATTE